MQSNSFRTDEKILENKKSKEKVGFEEAKDAFWNLQRKGYMEYGEVCDLDPDDIPTDQLDLSQYKSLQVLHDEKMLL